MEFLLSRCVGLATPDPQSAELYYRSRLGMRVVGNDAGTELAAGPVRLFIDPGPRRPLVLELLAPDLGEARAAVRSLGFEELVWKGRGQSCLVRDPYGLVANVFEDAAAFLPAGIEPPEEGVVKACIGALTPSPEPIAGFYSRILGSPVNRLADRSLALDSGPLRMRFREGPETRPALWLANDAPLDLAEGCGWKEVADQAFEDPFGVVWCAETIERATHAVVTPL
jgi:catechol 2,3-dioxygenase-like lactoylglutathione lyase family enzyme